MVVMKAGKKDDFVAERMVDLLVDLLVDEKDTKVVDRKEHQRVDSMVAWRVLLMAMQWG